MVKKIANLILSNLLKLRCWRLYTEKHEANGFLSFHIELWAENTELVYYKNFLSILKTKIGLSEKTLTIFSTSGHKRSMLHSRQPLESAARRRSRHRLHSDQPRKKSLRKSKASPSSSKEGALQDASRSRKSGLTPGGFSRSVSDPSNDMVSRVTSFNEADDSEEVSQKLVTISEEDVQVSGLAILIFSNLFIVLWKWFSLVHSWL